MVETNLEMTDDTRLICGFRFQIPALNVLYNYGVDVCDSTCFKLQYLHMLCVSLRNVCTATESA